MNDKNSSPSCGGTSRYNFVICGLGGYYDYGYADLMGLPDVAYCHTPAEGIANPLLRFAVRANYSSRVCRLLRRQPGRWAWRYAYTPHFADESRPRCYVFFGALAAVYQSGYVEYLRRRYPTAKFVLYMQDIVARNAALDLDYCRRAFDLLLSYDKGDCERYGMLYHPTPMSCVPMSEAEAEPEYDVYFCGYAKRRYPLVGRLYKEYTAAGLRCDFHLLLYPDGEPRVPGIHYNGPVMSYADNLRHVCRSRAVLEVMQDGATGFTPRLWEAIVYDRHLITNNLPAVAASPYYDAATMHAIDAHDLPALLRKPATHPAETKESLSPRHLLRFIEDNLADKQ